MHKCLQQMKGVFRTEVIPIADAARRSVHDMRCSSVASGGSRTKLCLNASVITKISSAPIPEKSVCF